MKQAKSEHEFQQEIEGKSAAYKYLHKARRATRAVYNSFWLQMFVASVIVCSFTVDVTEAEVPHLPGHTLELS